MITDQHFQKLLQHNRKYSWRHAVVGVAVIGLAVAVLTVLNEMDSSDLVVNQWDPMIKGLSNLAGGSVGAISFFPFKKILSLRDRRSDIIQTRDLWQLEMEQAERSVKNLEKIEAIYWQLCDIGNKP